MKHLYELTADVMALQKMADEAEDYTQFADTIELIEGEFEKKAAGVVLVTRNIETPIAAIDAEIERLQKMKKSIQGRAEWLTNYLRDNMEASGITKIECASPPFTITLVKGREVAVIDAESDLPDDYMRVSTSVAPDKIAIAKALKEGVEVPGAHLGLGKSSIRIK